MLLGGGGSIQAFAPKGGISMRIFDQEFGKLKSISDHETDPPHGSAGALDEADPSSSPSAISCDLCSWFDH